MKYCSKCGAQMVDEAVICVKCGCAVMPMPSVNEKAASQKSSVLKNLAFVFMLLSVVFWTSYALFMLLVGIGTGELVGMLIGLLFLTPIVWQLPMTIICYQKKQSKEPIGLAFKVCTMFFVNIIAGILLLCDND